MAAGACASRLIRSAFLLLHVEPEIGKGILPWSGRGLPYGRRYFSTSGVCPPLVRVCLRLLGWRQATVQLVLLGR